MKQSVQKFMLFAMSFALLLPILTACDDDKDDTSVYYITVSESDSNFMSNLYLQIAISDVIKTDQPNNVKLGTKSDAIKWFDSCCNKILDPEFVKDIPMGETTFTLALKEASSNPDSEGKTIKSKEITLSK